MAAPLATIPNGSAQTGDASLHDANTPHSASPAAAAAAARTTPGLRRSSPAMPASTSRHCSIPTATSTTAGRELGDQVEVAHDQLDGGEQHGERGHRGQRPLRVPAQRTERNLGGRAACLPYLHRGSTVAPRS